MVELSTSRKAFDGDGKPDNSSSFIPHENTKITTQTISSSDDIGDSDSELECLPDSCGKYAHQKLIGTWHPSAKEPPKEVSEVSIQQELLKITATNTLGGTAVSVGTAGITSDCCRRAIREKLQLAAHTRDRRDLFGALRWMISAYFLCKTVKKNGKTDVIGGDGELIEQVARVNRELRTKIHNQLKNGQALSLKTGLEEAAQHHHSLGCAAREKNDLVTAMREFKTVLKLRLKAVGESHPETALARSHVATVIRDMGNLQGAMVELRKALKIQEASLGEGHPHVAISRNNIGAVLKHQGQATLALAEHRKALVILVRYYGASANNKYMAEVHEHIGHALRLQGDIHGSVVEYEAALAIRNQIFDAQHPKTQRVAAKLKNLESLWRGHAADMKKRMEDRQKGGTVEWKCPACSWKTSLAICSCCGYRQPMSKEGIPQVFTGMTMVFTGIIPKSVHPSAWQEWIYAEQRGAVVTETVDDTCTHLIYREGYEKSGKVQLAQQLHIKVILADWFYQSVNLGVALDEAPFVAEPGNNTYESRAMEKITTKNKNSTKKMPHVRPGGGVKRAITCPPCRYLLAPPNEKGSLSKVKLPGPTPMVDQSSLSPRLGSFQGTDKAPASPMALRAKPTSGQSVASPVTSPSPQLDMSAGSMAPRSPVGQYTRIDSRNRSAFTVVPNKGSCWSSAAGSFRSGYSERRQLSPPQNQSEASNPQQLQQSDVDTVGNEGEITSSTATLPMHTSEQQEVSNEAAAVGKDDIEMLS